MTANPSWRHLSWMCLVTGAIGLFAVFPVAIAHGQPGDANAPGANLEELLRLAEAANPEIAMSYQELRAAEARVDSADVLPDPLFGIEFRDNELDGGLWPKKAGDRLYTLRQMFPLGGRRGLRREDASAAARLSSGRVSQARAELRSRMKSAYAEYYQIAARSRLNRELLGSVGAMVRLMESRYAQGLASQADPLKAQLERNMLEADRIRLEGERARVRIRINMLLARPPEAALAEPTRLRQVPPVSGLDRAALARRARERAPAAAIQTADVERAEVARKLADRTGYPDLELGFGVMERDGKATAYEAMVTVSLPLWFGARDAMRREAAEMAAAAGSKMSMVHIQLQAELQEILAELAQTQSTLRLLRESSEPQARLAFQATLTGLEQGRVEAAMAIDALRQLRTVQADILNMEMEEQSRLAALERLLGEDL